MTSQTPGSKFFDLKYSKNKLSYATQFLFVWVALFSWNDKYIYTVPFYTCSPIQKDIASDKTIKR